MGKILGKYEIIEKLDQDRYKAKYVNKEFEITQIKRDENNESFSFTASRLNHLSHKNLSTLRAEDDDEYFYLIKECFDFENLSETFMVHYDDEEEPDYKHLFECYLQLCGALQYIDTQGLYHGNINPSNILIDTSDEESYQVFLLDFGKSYYYKDFTQKVDGLRFYAPEQIGLIDSTPSIKSDIYAFGLCMLKLLLDSFEDCKALDSYRSPQDLETIFQAVQGEYELTDIENEILLLVKKCCCVEPEDRISLGDLCKEILRLYDTAVPKNTYELKCENNKTLKRYAENHNLDVDKLDSIMKHIQERITGYTAYILQSEDKNKKTGEIESKLAIAINDLIFVCSAEMNDNDYLWVWQVRENEPTRRIEKIATEGLELRHNFVFTTKDYYAPKSRASNIATLKNELDYRFKLNKLEIEQKKINVKAIASEERLLEAIKKDIDSKKKTHFASLTEIKRGADELIFTLIEPKDRQENEIESSPKDSKESTQAFKPPFKPKEVVIIQEKDNINSLKQDDSFKGVIKSYDAKSKQLTIKLNNKYDALFDESKEKELKTKEWAISYDYQVREILWSKQNSALEELKKGNTQIPNLLRKINDPTELKENEQREIESYFNENLDENQQEAVRKALSLESECEILLIQGPPGTGKTTTITEIVKQYQRFHKHYKILITSQSNQAVDNVLEKICVSKDNPSGEDKLFRIGNREEKMSKIAKQYTPGKVLDKILKENRERIKHNTITDSNPMIESKLQELQQGFLKTLETLSSKMANADTTKTKGKRDNETFRLFTKDIRLFFGTLLGISSWKSFRDVVFDVAIVDEAGRATLSELLVPCIKAKRIILVGDHKQLAPVVEDDVIEKLNTDSKKGSDEFRADKKDVTTSLFERLFERIESKSKDCVYLENFKHTLTYNYRAHKSICDLYSNAFYKGNLQTKPKISAAKAHNLRAFKTNAVWLDTGKISDKEDKQKDTGKINHCNARIIDNRLKCLKDEILSSEIKDIGIITPYKHQSSLLNRRLKSIQEEYKKAGISIDIGTVDSFQGSDRDMIIYDCVRSSKAENTQQTQKKRQGSKIDFIADEKRLNVSLSRSKKLLLIVGDKEYLRTASVSDGENPFSAIIKEFDNTKKYQVIELPDSKK